MGNILITPSILCQSYKRKNGDTLYVMYIFIQFFCQKDIITKDYQKLYIYIGHEFVIFLKNKGV